MAEKASPKPIALSDIYFPNQKGLIPAIKNADGSETPPMESCEAVMLKPPEKVPVYALRFRLRTELGDPLRGIPYKTIPADSRDPEENLHIKEGVSDGQGLTKVVSRLEGESIDFHISWPKINLGKASYKPGQCEMVVPICMGKDLIDAALEDIDSEMRARYKNNLYNMGIGHEMSYFEAIWLWRNGNGAPALVDGRVLRAGFGMALPDLTPWGALSSIAKGRLPWDSTKVFGHVSTNEGTGIKYIPFDDRIYHDGYDFNHMNAPWWRMDLHVRNALNEAAIDENGVGQPYKIKIHYEDRYFIGSYFED